MPSTFLNTLTSYPMASYPRNETTSPFSGIPPAGSGSIGSDSSLPSPEDGNPHVIPRLSALISEIYETCLTLRESPWANLNNPLGMNDYPIGRVLHPSQEFINILQKIALKGQNSAPELDPTSSWDCFEQPGNYSYNSINGLTTQSSIGSTIGYIADAEARLQDLAEHAPNSSHPSGAEGIMEAPTMLLVLSCLVSLTKLYGIAFTHFERYLSWLPPAPSPSGSADIGLIRTRGLQLGELRLLDNTYSKTYTGVRMLLDTFKAAEDVIGLLSPLGGIGVSAQQRAGAEGPAPSNELKGPSPWMAFQGELTQAVLEHDALIGGSSVQERFHALSMKIQSLKRVLRESMDLDA
ncbi:hypothetical protein DL765_010856 [Monosporascus sp. GIB2]|nr:hypothetical protein DL765_010856 [Monosporascus sp. GIB2]